MSERKQPPPSLSQIQRLEINSIQFAIEAGISFASAARAHRQVGNDAAGREAARHASAVYARVQPRVRRIQSGVDSATWLRDRLTRLKEMIDESPPAPEAATPGNDDSAEP